MHPGMQTLMVTKCLKAEMEGKGNKGRDERKWQVQPGPWAKLENFPCINSLGEIYL